MHAPHTGEKPLEKIKSADTCCLPPCKATPASLPDVLPAGHGWELDGKTSSILWYDKPHTPAHVRSNLLEEDINNEDEQMHLASSDEDDD